MEADKKGWWLWLLALERWDGFLQATDRSTHPAGCRKEATVPGRERAMFQICRVGGL